jgi:hypothetical protein
MLLQGLVLLCQRNLQMLTQLAVTSTATATANN